MQFMYYFDFSFRYLRLAGLTMQCFVLLTVTVPCDRARLSTSLVVSRLPGLLATFGLSCSFAPFGVECA